MVACDHLLRKDFLRSSLPVSRALIALSVEASVPGALGRCVVVSKAVTAESVVRQDCALAIMSASLPLPEANTTFSWSSAAQLAVLRDINAISRLNVVHQSHRVAHGDLFFIRNSTKLHTVGHLVGERELLRELILDRL